jgi:hypothetical protein
VGGTDFFKEKRMYKICPHCFGEYQEHDGVSLSPGVEICDACADGGAAFAAFDEWLNTKTSKTFAEWMLESIGYEIKEDSDQPGLWLWVALHGEASDTSFHAKEDAIKDAQRHARGDIPSNDDYYETLVEGDEVWWNDPDDGIGSGYYYIAEIKLPENGATITPSTVVVLENKHGTVIEAFVSELSPDKPKCEITNRLRLVLDVEYRLHDESIEQMQVNLRNLVDKAIGEGLLTGCSSAEVDGYSVDVSEHPDISEDEIADYFAVQMDDGLISPSEVPRRFARYGMMDAIEFAAEMQERIEMAKEE